MIQFTKESLIDSIRSFNRMGFIQTKRPGNQGGVGNTLEDLLGIEENNLPMNRHQEQ